MAIFDLNNTNNIPRFGFPSHRLPISSEYESRNANEDDRPQFQDTVPLGGPVDETGLCNLDTELLYDSDLGGDYGKKTEPPCEYEEEMVLDSEDEEINGSRLVNVTKSLPDNMAEKRSEQLCAGSGVSKTSFGNEKDLHGQSASEAKLVRLNNQSNQEYEEWSHSHSQAEALCFVDHFVLTNKVDISQGTEYGKICKEKSPAVPSAKGPRNLARRINQQTHIKENWKFEFIDNDPHEGLGSFRKKRSLTSHQADLDADDRGYTSFGDEGRDRKGIPSFDKKTKGLSGVDKGFAGHSSKHGSEITQVYEANNEVNSSKEMELAGKRLEASDIGNDTLEIYDFGLNTQIAAEAIEALAHGHCLSYGSAYACQDRENNAGSSLGDVAENNARLKLPFVQASVCDDVGDILGSAKRKKRSDRRSVKRRHFGRDICSFSKKESGIEELDSELTKSSSVARSKFSAETKLRGNNSATSDESSGRSNAKPIKQSEEGVLEKNHKIISATPIRKIPLTNEQSECQGMKVSPLNSRTGQQDPGVRLNRSEDRSTTPGKKANDNIDQGVLAYRRQRSRLNANPLKVLSVRGKSLELCYSSEGARMSILNPSKSDMWNCPKGQRTSRKVGKHSNRSIDLNVSFNSHNQERTTGKANMKEKAKSTSCARPCVPGNSSRNDFPGSLSGKSFAKTDLGVSVTVSSGSECITSVAVGVQKDHTLTPASISSKTGKNVVPSNNIYNGHQKRPCKKNSHKTSLLKELINLGVSKQIPEFRWKELRRRRDMSHVRVLFSQHLDDDIVKQQRKVVARLGTSIVSCSMDATHFIADKFARTKNMLEAIALGKPVVTHQWLESCGQANCFIDEKNYILRDAKKEKEFGFSMPVSLARANQHPLLKGQRVFVTPNINPQKEMIINLVKAVHGQALEKPQISSLNDENIPEGLLILSCKEDHSICLPFLKKGSAVYSSELLLNGIVTQKLEYKRHQLFADDVKRNYS